MCVPAFAVNNRVEEHVIFEAGGVKISAYMDTNGSTVFQQFQDGELVQRNIVNPNEPGVVRREFFGSNVLRGISSDTININDYGVVVKDEPNLGMRAKNYIPLGTINYRAVIDTGAIYYGIKCSYNRTYIGNTTYTINNFVGKIIDLIAIAASALELPYAIADNYFRKFVVGLGIAAGADYISKPFTETVSCRKWQYDWELVDTTLSAHKKELIGKGYEYYINDVESSHTNERYCDGYTTDIWAQQSLAVWFHNEMFDYNAWAVVSWS